MTKFEIIIASSAVAISLIALIYTAVDSRHSRKHNKLSVRPILVSKTSISASGDQIGISIANNGTGPAIMSGFALFLGDHSVDLQNNFNDNLIKHLDKLNINASWVHVQIPPFEVLRPGETVWIISHKKSESSRERYHLFVNALNKINYKIKYNSIYNEKYLYESLPLELSSKQLNGVPPTWPQKPEKE